MDSRFYDLGIRRQCAMLKHGINFSDIKVGCDYYIPSIFGSERKQIHVYSKTNNSIQCNVTTIEDGKQKTESIFSYEIQSNFIVPIKKLSYIS